MTGMSLSKLIERTRKPLSDPLKRQIKNIAYRARLKLLTSGSNLAQEPHDLFRGIGDGFWFWLNTEGCRISSTLRNILPTMPEEDVQLGFTGDKGDAVMRDGFAAYRLFRNLYEHHVGPIAHCENILDFGCGWGRIIRFFLKDIEPSRLLGVDPVEEMVALCKQQNRWCVFERIPNVPPSHLKENTFEWIYSFSVFSHLSEEMHNKVLAELSRLLKPGGLLVVTTRGREFIEACAAMRKHVDLSSLHPGPRSSAGAFPETQEALLRYDRGDYCFTPLVHEGEWAYWGEAAISKNYVLKNWGYGLTFLDYIHDRNLCSQDVVVMKKGTS
jgi:SAM-dependent methyltransferase